MCLLLLGIAPFTAAQAPIVNEIEPNNSLAFANPFTVGSTITGNLEYSITTPDDSDWFTFTTEVNGKVRFHGYPQSTLAIGLELWKEGMTWPVAQIGHWIYVGVEQAIEYNNLAKGTYHLRVVRHGESSGTYTIQTSLSPPTRAMDEDAEPNDSMNMATPVALNTVIKGHLGYSDFEYIDQDDWYTFTTDVDGEIRFHGIPDSTFSMVMHLWNDQMTIPMVEVGHNVYQDEEKTLVYPNLAAGTYKLRVHYAARYGSYEIDLGFTPTRLAYQSDSEPNNLLTEALLLRSGEPYSGTLGFSNGQTTDTEDWYRFNTEEDGSIRLWTSPDTTLATAIGLFTEDGTLMTQVGHHSFLGVDQQLSIANLLAGEYRVRILNGSHGSYDLTLDYVPGIHLSANDAEPNNDVNTAQHVPVNTLFSARLGFTNILATDETDWFSFETQVSGPVTIRSYPDSVMAVGIQLFNENNEFIQGAGHYSFIGLPVVISVPELTPGKYKLQVGRGGFGSYRTIIETKDTALPDSNDSFETATPIQIGDIYAGSLMSLPGVNLDDMVDWYSFSVPFDGAFSMIIQPDSADLNTWVQLGRADGFVFKSSDPYENANIGQADTIVFRNLMRGDYTLRVSGYGIGTYRFQTFFEPMFLTDDVDAADTEPNDDQEAATWVPLNTLMTGHLGYDAGERRDLEDWYRFTSAGGGTEIHFQAYYQLGAVLRLYNESGSYVTSEISSNSDTPGIMAFENLDAGIYWIQLHRWGTGGVNDYFGPYGFIVVSDSTVQPEPLLSGRITNAVNGEPIPGASVTVGSITVLTDSLGMYAFTELPPAPTQVGFVADSTFGEAPLLVRFDSWVRDGFHTMTVRADGFDLFVFSSLIIAEPMQFDLSLSPTLTQADLRIVLNWGATPRDLDSHIRTPDGYHVYYSNRGDPANAPFTVLDHDDVDSFGPETITLVQRRSGTYQYYIHNYSDDAAITASGAVVRFYDGAGLLTSVEVPTTGDGLYWYVADIDGETGRIDLVNRIQTTEPGTVITEKAVAKVSRTTSVEGWTYAWDFGDGSSSDMSAPEHLYTQAGVYTVSLTATLDEHSAQMIRRDYIHVTEPEPEHILAVNDTVTVVAGTIVRIDPMANDHLPDTLVVHLGLDDWATNYGILMSTADHLGLIYASAVNARGIDSLRYTLYYEGGSTSATIYIHVVDGIVRNQAPVVALPVEISILEDSTLVIPMRKLVFDDHDAAAQLTIVVMSVHPAVTATLSAGKDTLRISALPNWWGTSVLTLTATDREGGSTTDHVALTFIPVNDAPVAVFLKTAEELTTEGLVVDFQDQSHDTFDPEGAIASWMWDFGDGHTSTQRHPRHTYTTSGTFTVRLSVTDNAGGVSSMETTVVSEFTSIDDHERITEFALGGAYPNPFNPTTVLRIDVPEAGEVVIEVYTSMGQRVATLREALTAGSHSVQVDAIGWSSGVYLYTVRYRDQTAIGKMTLIK